MSLPPPLISLLKVHKSYFERPIHVGLDLHIQAGRFYALLGENGSGKSTLMRMLAGIEAPDQGVVMLRGEDIGGASPEARAMVGYVSEALDFALDADMLETAHVLADLYPLWDWDLFHKIIKERKFPIKKRFAACSRGQKMQFALILALCQGARLLLLDEMTSVLDVYARKYFMAHLTDFVNKGGSVVLATNIIHEVQSEASDLIFIRDRKVAIDAPLSQIPQGFKKIRQVAGTDHPIFKEPQCFWAGNNSDGSTSYIVPLELAVGHHIDASMEDRRTVLLEDIFVYYFNMKDEAHEQAA